MRIDSSGTHARALARAVVVQRLAGGRRRPGVDAEPGWRHPLLAEQEHRGAGQLGRWARPAASRRRPSTAARSSCRRSAVSAWSRPADVAGGCAGAGRADSGHAWVAGRSAAAVLLAGCSSGGGDGAVADARPARPPASGSSGTATTVTGAGGRPATGRPITAPRPGRRLASLPASDRLTVSARLALDGAVYASPLVVDGLTIVATENNTVYAFDAAYRQVWKQHLGTPSPADERPCGNIDPLGITGTPVYDAATGTVFVAHRAERARAAPAGRASTRTPVRCGGSQPRLPRRRRHRHAGARRAGPSPAAGCGCPSVGWPATAATTRAGVIGCRPTAPAARSCTPCRRRARPVSGRRPAPSVDAAGRLLVAVGNGEAGPGDATTTPTPCSRSTPRARRVDSFSPTTWPPTTRTISTSARRARRWSGPWVFSAGKSGTAYVLAATISAASAAR